MTMTNTDIMLKLKQMDEDIQNINIINTNIILKLDQMDENIQNINARLNDFIQFKHACDSMNIIDSINHIRCGTESDGKFHRLDTYFIDLNQKLSQLIENQKYIDTIIGSHNRIYHDPVFQDITS